MKSEQDGLRIENQFRVQSHGSEKKTNNKNFEVNFVPKDVVTIESKRWLEKNISSQKTSQRRSLKKLLQIFHQEIMVKKKCG